MIMKFFQRKIMGFFGILAFKENDVELVCMESGDEIASSSKNVNDMANAWEKMKTNVKLDSENAKRVSNNHPEGLIPRNIFSIAPEDDVLQSIRFYALLLQTIVLEQKSKAFLCLFALGDSSPDTHRCLPEQLVNNDDTLAAHIAVCEKYPIIWNNLQTLLTAVSATAYQVEALQHFFVFHLLKAKLLIHETTSCCLLLGSASSESGSSPSLPSAVAPTSLRKRRLPISYLEAGDSSKRGVKRKPILRGRKRSLTSLSRPNSTFRKSVGGLPRPQFGACTAASYWLWNYPRSIFRVNCTSLRGFMTAPAALVWWKVSTFIGLVRSLRALFETYYLISLFLEALVSSPVKGRLLILFRHVSDPPATLVVSNKCQSFIFSLNE